MIRGPGKDFAIGNIAIAVGFIGTAEEIFRLRIRSNRSLLLVLRWICGLDRFNNLAVFPFDLDRTATETASILDPTDHRATGRFLAVSTTAAVLDHEGLAEIGLGADGGFEIAYDEAAAFFGAGWGLDDDGTPSSGS